MTTVWKDMSREQRIAAVQTLRADKLSFDAIAGRFRTTRNVIAGIVHRHCPELKSNYGDQLRPAKKAARKAKPSSPSIVTPISAARKRSDPLFVRRVKTSIAWEDRGSAPSSANPIPFGKTDSNVCLCFLPGQPNTHLGLVCANPVPAGRLNRVCDSCSEWFYSKAALVVMKRRAA